MGRGLADRLPPAEVGQAGEDAIPEEQLTAWTQRIEPSIDFECLPGGHFFIHDERTRLLAAIARQLSDTLREPPVVLTS